MLEIRQNPYDFTAYFVNNKAIRVSASICVCDHRMPNYISLPFKITETEDMCLKRIFVDFIQIRKLLGENLCSSYRTRVAGPVNIFATQTEIFSASSIWYHV